MLQDARHALRDVHQARWPRNVWTLQKEEDFFACKWTVNEATGDNLLLAAGLNAALRVINVSNETLQWVGSCQRSRVSGTAMTGECCARGSRCALNSSAACGRRRRAMATPSTT